MAGKTKDTRPARAKQKLRSVTNKIEQLKEHITKFPEDKNAIDKLEKVQKTSNSRRVRIGVHPTDKVIARYADGKTKRDTKLRSR
jgi:hypothetical protein